MIVLCLFCLELLVCVALGWPIVAALLVGLVLFVGWALRQGYGLRAVGGIDKLIDWEKKHPQIDLLRYLSSDRDKEDKVFDDPSLMKTPVVRNGKKATVGYCPEVWAGWE